MGFHFKFQKLLEIEKCREEDIVKELKKLQRILHDEEKLLVFLQSVLSLQQSEMEKELHMQSEANVFVANITVNNTANNFIDFFIILNFISQR